MKDIAFKDNTIAEEKGLPYPIVLYPKHYGVFIGFKRNLTDSQVFFCSCFKEAIVNYIKHQLENPGIGTYGNGQKIFFLDYGQFPTSFIQQIKNYPQNDKIVQMFHFENKLCHECNNATPSYRYCHEMYGSVFKQNYGWYIKKHAYEWGIIGNEVDFKLCPDEIIDLLKIEPIEYFKLFREFLSNKKIERAFELQSKFNKQQRKIWNVIENEVRERFGHKKIGEAWTSETILYYMIEKLYPERTIFRHFRPEFLEGLEIDIFIKEFNLGIEYQGIQHYKPVKHWGGEAALKKLKERDDKKKKICGLQNISLIYFKYNEDLSEEFVSNRLKQYI